MGDWTISTLWGHGPRPTPRAVLSGDRGALAARVGWVGTGGLWQLDVLRKYGRFVLDHGGRRPSGTKPAAGRSGTGCVTLSQTGWNYLLSERPETSGLLHAAADLLGHGRATVVVGGGPPMLCLADVVPCDQPDMDWELSSSYEDPSAEARVIEALALAGAQTRTPQRSTFVLGLWTSAYGYVHTGRLTLVVDRSLHWCGCAERHLTGQHNELHGEQTAGEYAHSTYFERGPLVSAPTAPWPSSSGLSAAASRTSPTTMARHGFGTE